MVAKKPNAFAAVLLNEIEQSRAAMHRNLALHDATEEAHAAADAHYDRQAAGLWVPMGEPVPFTIPGHEHTGEPGEPLVVTHVDPKTRTITVSGKAKR